ncbi:phosphoribosylglycinamide formyltransferase [Aurantibacillus circumpalustris]|uniref:phosphoribosylglycinamide formyltransferase n=1 Tax=Aurantibacillus circumpalustris TaxID=3036359 RepID=UPI00295B0B47|nr:phosphoribosylglycinamide formyltransferase [Aurantibacillus circumpalustris]
MYIKCDFRSNFNNYCVIAHYHFVFKIYIFAAMINAAIFASGEGTNAENLFIHFANDPRIKIKLVVTNKDDAGIVVRAEKHKKNVQIVSKAALENYSDKLIEFLQVEKIDLIILAGFLLKIPEAFIKAFPNKIINLHPALLPKYGGAGMYGMRVHTAVIDNKEKESGITVHFVNEEYDKGEIILQVKTLVTENETPESLAKKIQQLEFEYLPKAVEKFL